MGYYTELKSKSIIKPEYRESVRKVVFEDVKWGDLFNHSFVSLWRADLIPFGENKLGLDEIFDGVTFTVNCSINNYEDELDMFFEFLKEISSDVLEYRTFDEDNYDYVERVGHHIKVMKWYNFLTGKLEKIEQKVEEVE